MGIKELLLRRGYHLGFVDGSIGDIVYSTKSYNKVRWVDLNGHRASWFADPFIFNTEGDYIEVLAEEFEYSKNKGRLSHLLIKKDSLKLVAITPILELDTHLSFPAYIRKNNKTYVYPENYISGGIKIYEYDHLNKKLVNPKEILREELVDAQLLELNGYYYLMGVKHEDDKFTYNYTKDLYVFKSEDLLGEYTFFQKISNTKKEERGAGHLFNVGDKLIRPAQNCDGGYGVEVVFYEFTQGKDGCFKEVEIGRMSPGYNKYPFVLHTFNTMGKYHIIDGMGFENNIIRPMLTKLIQLYSRYQHR